MKTSIINKLMILTSLALVITMIILSIQGADINNVLFSQQYKGLFVPTELDFLQVKITIATLIVGIATIINTIKEI